MDLTGRDPAASDGGRQARCRNEYATQTRHQCLARASALRMRYVSNPSRVFPSWEQVSTGQLVRMAPIYQEMRVPDQAQQSFTLLDAFVPISNQSQIQTSHISPRT